MWGGLWYPLASFWKLCNLGSHKVLHLWLNHDHPWGGRAWWRAEWAAEVCLPCSPMLLTLLLVASQLLGVSSLLYLRQVVPFTWPELPAHLDTSALSHLPHIHLGDISCPRLFRVWAMGQRTWALAYACPSIKKKKSLFFPDLSRCVFIFIAKSVLFNNHGGCCVMVFFSISFYSSIYLCSRILKWSPVGGSLIFFIVIILTIVQDDQWLHTCWIASKFEQESSLSLSLFLVIFWRGLFVSTCNDSIDDGLKALV